MRLFTSLFLAGSFVSLLAAQSANGNLPAAFSNPDNAQFTATQSINQGQRIGHRGSGRFELAAKVLPLSPLLKQA
jgi:hypothetical protein